MFALGWRQRSHAHPAIPESFLFCAFQALVALDSVLIHGAHRGATSKSPDGGHSWLPRSAKPLASCAQGVCRLDAPCLACPSAQHTLGRHEQIVGAVQEPPAAILDLRTLQSPLFRVPEALVAPCLGCLSTQHSGAPRANHRNRATSASSPSADSPHPETVEPNGHHDEAHRTEMHRFHEPPSSIMHRSVIAARSQCRWASSPGPSTRRLLRLLSDMRGVRR